jgi:toxin YoeB
MNYQIFFEKIAKNDIDAIKKSGDNASMKKLNIILEELEIHPQTGTGNPEQLKHQLSGF